MTLYGIKNCNTVKQARNWLRSQSLDIPFHDFREQGLDEATLSQWVKLVGWEALLNKRSTSFRALNDVDKLNLDQKKAMHLMLANPTLIKRPVLAAKDKVIIGFNEADYQAWIGQ